VFLIQTSESDVSRLKAIACLTISGVNHGLPISGGVTRKTSIALSLWISIAASIKLCFRRTSPVKMNSSNPSMLGDGAGFYRFPAWAGMKPNDVSPGHVARMFAAPNVRPEHYPRNPYRPVTR